MVVEFFFYYATLFNPFQQSIHLADGKLKKRFVLFFFFVFFFRKNHPDDRIIQLLIIDPYNNFTIARSDLLAAAMYDAFKLIWHSMSEGLFIFITKVKFVL